MFSSPDPKQDFDLRPGPERIQFRLGSMLGLLAISAFFLGISKQLGIGYGMAVFAIALFAFMGLIYSLICVVRRTSIVVFEGKTNAEAHLCRNYLRENEVRAVVLEGNAHDITGWTIRPPQVVVPVEQAEQAWDLLAKRAGWGEGPPEET